VKGNDLPGATDSPNGFHTVHAFGVDSLKEFLSNYAILDAGKIREIIFRSKIDIPDRDACGEAGKFNKDDFSMEMHIGESIEGELALFFKRSAEMMEKNRPLYLMTADLIMMSETVKYGLHGKSRYIDVGIREQHLFALAHGLSISNPEARVGGIPLIHQRRDGFQLRHGPDDFIGFHAGNHFFHVFVIGAVLQHHAFRSGVEKPDAFFFHFFQKFFFIFRFIGFRIAPAAGAVAGGKKSHFIFVRADPQISRRAHGRGDKDRFAGLGKKPVRRHSFRTVGPNRSVAVNPQIFAEMRFAMNKNMGRVIEQIQFRIDSQSFFQRLIQMISENGAIGETLIGSRVMRG